MYLSDQLAISSVDINLTISMHYSFYQISLTLVSEDTS